MKLTAVSGDKRILLAKKPCQGTLFVTLIGRARAVRSRTYVTHPSQGARPPAGRPVTARARCRRPSPPACPTSAASSVRHGVAEGELFTVPKHNLFHVRVVRLCFPDAGTWAEIFVEGAEGDDHRLACLQRFNWRHQGRYHLAVGAFKPERSAREPLAVTANGEIRPCLDPISLSLLVLQNLDIDYLNRSLDLRRRFRQNRQARHKKRDETHPAYQSIHAHSSLWHRHLD